MAEKTLRMIFVNAGANTVVIATRYPKDGLTDLEVKTCMETIIAKNLFLSNGGDLVTIKGAEVVEKTTTELAVA